MEVNGTEEGRGEADNPENKPARKEGAAALISQVQNIPAEIAEKFLNAKGILAGSGIDERFREWQRKNLNS
ncbi:MAG: hypothetical protein HUU54_12145 [Ignavibacteriaceae bacterium]|nr:hypothetical protein [Ignavibacteriaceae bacterium]